MGMGVFFCELREKESKREEETARDGGPCARESGSPQMKPLNADMEFPYGAETASEFGGVVETREKRFPHFCSGGTD